MKHRKLEEMGLDDLLGRRMQTTEEINALIGQLKSMKTPYSALYPLKRLKGKLQKVH